MSTAAGVLFHPSLRVTPADARLSVPAPGADRRALVRDVAGRLLRRLCDRRSGRDACRPEPWAGGEGRGGPHARPQPPAHRTVPHLSRRSARGRFRALVHLWGIGSPYHPGARAGDLRAGIRGHGDRGRVRHPTRHSCRALPRPAPRPRRARRLHSRFQPAFVLGGADADHVLRGLPRMAAVRRPRADPGRARRSPSAWRRSTASGT